MALKRDEVERFLQRHGFRARPAFPHIFYNDQREGTRYYLSTLGLRKETRTPSGEWVRVRSGYFKNLALSGDDKLQGMNMRGM